MAFRMRTAAVLAAGAVTFVGLSLAAPAAAFAADPVVVVWDKNGTTNGACKTIGDFGDLSPAPGKQGWLFIMTSPFSGSGSQLSYSFSDLTASPPTVAGVQKGNGSYHFVVYTNAGATLLSASATNGKGQSILTVSHCELGNEAGEDPVVVITSEVHLAGTHTVVSNGSPAPKNSTVHDQVTLTITGLSEWSGTFTEKFFTNNDCSGDAADTFSTTWTQATGQPQDNLLAKGPLSPGGYSYLESFDSANDDLDIVGACEPFIVTDPCAQAVPAVAAAVPAECITTTTTEPDLPTTGSSLTGVVVSGVALVAAGAALVLLRRRRTVAGE